MSNTAVAIIVSDCFIEQTFHYNNVREHKNTASVCENEVELLQFE